jgi:hypothetical protein
MTTKTPAKRVDAIDFWRGFALLTIFIDHAPENAFQNYTIRNFGLSDAAELFVFLSGVSVALAYGIRFFNGETWSAIRAVFHRAFTLYWVQLLTSLLIIGLLAAAAGWWDIDDLVEDPDRDFVLSSPVQGIAAIIAMTHQLGNVNILPMYIALLLITPVLLLLARRSDWLMLGGSAALYAVARVFDLNIPTYPLDGTWYFNPLAWQLLFAVGIFVGRRVKIGGIGYDRRLYALCLAILAGAAFAVTDGFHLMPGLWTGLVEVLDHGKTDLGIARLVHFLALAYVISHSGITRLCRATPIFAPLSLIGRYSLQVFATGCVLAAVGEVIVETRPDDYAYPLTLGAFIIVGGILLHYAVARLLEWRRTAQPRPVRVPVPVPVGNVQLVGQVSHESA